MARGAIRSRYKKGQWTVTYGEVKAHPRRKPRGGITGVRKHGRETRSAGTLRMVQHTLEQEDRETARSLMPMVEAEIERPYIEAAPNSDAFENVAPADRQPGRYNADVSITSDGFAMVGLHDTWSGGFRSLFIGNEWKAREVARALRAGAVRPREGFLH